MSELTADSILRTFLRLVGVDADDDEWVRNGEAANEVAYTYLTIGLRAAQNWLIHNGLKKWITRTPVLSWSGSDAANGGTYVDLPSDFLRANGDDERSPLVEADGTRWGTLIEEEDKHWRGDFCYVANDQLWLAREAAPPSPVYLEYIERHDPWAASFTLDFPEVARCLIAPEAAVAAMDENWLPGGAEMKAGIQSAMLRARGRVRPFVRRTRKPRQLRKPRRGGNHW